MRFCVVRNDYPACGKASIAHDTETGAISIDFERLDDVYRLGRTLRHRWATCCANGGGGDAGRSRRHDGRRFSLALRLTEADSNLVYYTHSAEVVVVLRRGRVLKVRFEGMGQFEGRLGEIARDDRRMCRWHPSL
jgi:hypothetical protein